MNAYEQEHVGRLRNLLGECTVLLASNGDFPLASPGKIAAYGSGVRHTIKGGTGSGEVNSRFFVTVEQGLADAGFAVTTKKWLDGYDGILEKAKKEFIQTIRRRAKEHHTMAVLEGMGAVMPEPEYSLPVDAEGDAAVYVLSRISGEGNDRNPESGDIRLSATEVRDILLCREKYAKFMLVLNVGGPVDLTPVREVENILILSQLGVETGAALADILLGKQNPSGRLTTTWSAWEDYPEIGSFGDPDDTFYREGVYVGYRYFDSVGKKCAYPFGYGLSYTSFAQEMKDASFDGGRCTLSVEVENTGARPGRDAVQVYVSAPCGEIDKPYQVLAGFAKTKELTPGEKTVCEVTFALADIASYDTKNAAWVLEAGDYIVLTGKNCQETEPALVLELPERVTVLQAKNVLGDPGFEDWKPEQVRQRPDVSGIRRIPVDPASIACGEVDYGTEDPVDVFVEGLTDEELCLYNIGAFNPKGGMMSMIGNASMSVAGAAGETCGKKKDAGFPVLVMSDGPAGLRLAKEYFIGKDGNPVAVGMTLPATIADFLPGIAKFFMKLTAKKPGKNDTILEQYATAIPIGTAIAQSFNTELAEACGDIVGDEMERFGVHLWLAPALNIHRSIRCGRNFEYFSEDPFVSGCFAAAITNGVQKHKGCGTTIKHYAANNQETNRYTNNSHVSERAMREIYLRGFGIAVRESNPAALMTSYNLLNGVHTSEHAGLVRDVLRREYGYQGIVMTDWVVQGMGGQHKYRYPVSAKVAASTNDLFMPGSGKDFEDMKAGLGDGTVTRKQLMENATRVYRKAKELTGK